MLEVSVRKLETGKGLNREVWGDISEGCARKG